MTPREEFKSELKSRISKIEKLELLLSEIEDMIDIFGRKDDSNDLVHKFRTSYNRETLISNNELLKILEDIKENRETEITKLYTELLTLKVSQL